MGTPPKAGVPESVLQKRILAVLNHPSSPCRLWRNQTGAYRPPGGGFIRYGLGVGGADLVGMVQGTGQFLAVEIKTPIGRLSDEQKAWLETVRRFGGISVVIRSVEEAQALVNKLRGQSHGTS